MKTEYKIGLIGCGTVGGGVALILRDLEKNPNFDSILHLKYICDRSKEKVLNLGFSEDIFTPNPDDVLNDPEVDVVIELIGGIEPAKSIILKALERGKHVVTANKALLATHWDEIFTCANKHSREIGFEASVAGGIPIIKTLKEALIANNIKKIIGIVNGTTNYILTKMQLEQKDFDETLKEAQKLGYAEADPTFDIEGIDAAHKIIILSNLAFKTNAKLENIHCEGIREITLSDIKFAKELGYVIKLLAIAKLTEDNKLEIRVHPALIKETAPLSQVNYAYNALFIEADRVGKLMLQGLGAGRFPTASAVLADVFDVIKTSNHLSTPKVSPTNSYPIRDISERTGRFYACFYVVDKPGVLAKISGILGAKNISIASVIQKERSTSSYVPIVMITHEAKEKNIKEAICEIDNLDIVLKKTKLIRIEELSEWED